MAEYFSYLFNMFIDNCQRIIDVGYDRLLLIFIITVLFVFVNFFFNKLWTR